MDRPCLFRAKPGVAKLSLRLGWRVDRDDLQLRVLGDDDGRRLRPACSIDERDRDAIAGLVAAEHGADVVVAVDPLTIELADLIVLLDAGGVWGPVRCDDRAA